MPENFGQLTNEELYNRMVSLRAIVLENPETVQQIPALELTKEVIHRAQTDLFFLAKYFIGYENEENKLITEFTHRRVCDLFIKKDPTKTIAEQDWRKTRLLLYPRGSFKSTIDVIDAVQWILCFPNIRILFLTGADDLAVGFVSELKSHFVVRKDTPSFMNLFFPDFCVEEGKKESEFVFTCPKRTLAAKEATVMANSIMSSLSGWHYDVLKADDMVETRNSEDEIQCKKVIAKFGKNKKVLMPYGYLDIIGTRYHEEDYYGNVIDKNVGNLEKSNGPCWDYTYNKDTGVQIIVGRAWQLKSGFEKVPHAERSAEHYDLLHPSYLTFAKLRYEESENEAAFESQYQNNPRPTTTTSFSIDLLKSHTVTFKEIPMTGPTVITWDFAFSKKKGRDFSTGCVARYDGRGKMFIVDLVRAKFAPQDLAKAVVDLAVKWRPMVIGIEKAAGSDFLMPTILNEARKTGFPDVLSTCNTIDWFSPDNQIDAKKSRMAALHPWLVNDMLYFASHLAYLDILYKEFEVCLISHHHDDIPDVISQQPRYAPKVQMVVMKTETKPLSREDAAWNIMFEENTDPFGRVGMGWTPPPLAPPEIQDNLKGQGSSDELDSMLGAGLIG